MLRSRSRNARDSGFTLLELVVSIMVATILLGIFLDRTLYYRELAEKSAMEQVVYDLRSSVNLRAAELVLLNKFDELARLAAANPVELLARKPANYLGVLTNPDKTTVGSGGWYFDNSSKEVVYCLVSTRFFVPDIGGSTCVSWRISIARTDGQPAKPAWVRLEPVSGYKWF